MLARVVKQGVFASQGKYCASTQHTSHKEVLHQIVIIP